jgi:hypothetical protein
MLNSQQRMHSAPISAAQLSRMEYDPSSPLYGSFTGKSPSRPGSSGGFASRTNLSRRSRRSSKSSPKHPPPPPVMRMSWPPPGYSPRTVISSGEALRLVGHGSLEFRGKLVETPLTQDLREDTCRYYATTFVDGRLAKDTVSSQDESLKDISLSFMGDKEGLEPWGSLEYPNMLYAFGKSPGTTTLTFFIGMRGQIRSPLDFGDSKARKRKLKLITILERLKELEMGLDEEVGYPFRNH